MTGFACLLLPELVFPCPLTVHASRQASHLYVACLNLRFHNDKYNYLPLDILIDRANQDIF